MRLPHPQWGSRNGTATPIGDLVTLAEDPKLDELPPEIKNFFSEALAEAAGFISRGSSEGEA